MSRVLVCGGRDFVPGWKDYAELASALTPFDTLIEGGARGADRFARDFAVGLNCKVETFNADWKKYGKAAGAIRNQAMIEARPDLVLAFPGGAGTADCVRRARKAGIEVRLVEWTEAT